MDGRTFLFGMIMLLLAPLLWPVAMLMPDRESREARRSERVSEVRRAVVAACGRGDLEEVRRLVGKWRRIDRRSRRPDGVLVVLGSTMSSEDKLRHVAWVAGGRDPWKPR